MLGRVHSLHIRGVAVAHRLDAAEKQRLDEAVACRVDAGEAGMGWLGEAVARRLSAMLNLDALEVQVLEEPLSIQLAVCPSLGRAHMAKDKSAHRT
jgi:hypothetical protein